MKDIQAGPSLPLGFRQKRPKIWTQVTPGDMLFTYSLVKPNSHMHLEKTRRPFFVQVSAYKAREVPIKHWKQWKLLQNIIFKIH